MVCGIFLENCFIIKRHFAILLHNLFKIILLNIFVSSLHAISLISPQLAKSYFLHFHCFTVALTN
ncbi:hypothetical protein CI630_24095 [Enterobacter hormaechei subsp. steigerwaltii]|nr:hypothetical protein CI630_24095 [Enterobacter hormaechei subsp. steigerwaltii]